MSQKRKLEEFHDPDYPQSIDNKKKCTINLKPNEKIEKISKIIKREFENELIAKEKEIHEIDNRLLQAKMFLHKVRFAIVSDYYDKHILQINNSEIEVGVGHKNLSLSKEYQQKPIHPALKSLLGKKSVDFDEILKMRPIREAAKTAKSCIKEKLRSKKEEKRLQREINEKLHNDTRSNEIVISHESKKIPRHISPLKVEKPLPQLNSFRGRNQTKHLIAVGNTSKFIGDEKQSDQEIYKWLIYVQTKNSVPIEQLVNKVRFFLHPSYKPNDIVNISSPPFQLSKLGWGEFPVRIQLFFHPKFQQKPVQLVHNLVLDNTLSGLQTMGAETLVEVWLPDDSSSQCKDEKTSTTENNKSRNLEKMNLPLSESDQFEGDNLLDFLNKIEEQSPTIYQEGDKIEPTITCSPIIDSGIIPPDKIILSKSLNNDVKKDEILTETKQETQDIENQFKSDVGSEQVIWDAQIGAEEIIQYATIEKQEQISNIPQNVEKNSTMQKMEVSDQGTIKQNNVQKTLLSLINPPKIFQKKIVKCIDKQGNIKLIPMFVSVNGQNNVQENLQNSKKENTVISTKLNNSPVKQSPVLQLINSSNQSKQAVQLECTVEDVNKSINNNSSMKDQQSIKNDLSKISETEKNSMNHNSIENLQSTNINEKELPNSSAVNNMPNNNNAFSKVKNQVFMKDGKMFIIDPLQAKIKQQNKKQESLLKPQVSLLKPIVKNDNLKNCIRNNSNQIFNHTALATDHDYTSLTPYKTGDVSSNVTLIGRKQQISNVITVNSPNNSPMNVIVTQTKPFNYTHSKRIGIPKIVLMQKPKRNFSQELEEKFFKMNLIGVRQAVEFLLKQLPLINSLAKDSEYKISFPFVVSEENIFKSFITPKQRCYEWLRAKYISKLVEKHNDAKNFDLWTTKEIILFARHHAYTPVITYAKDFLNNNVNSKNNETLQELVKKEIKKEKFYHHTITPAEDLYNWIQSTREKCKNKFDCEDEIIDIEKLDFKEDQIRNSYEKSPNKNLNNDFWLPVNSNIEDECIFVNEKCQEIGIRLQPEEIVPGILHQSTQVVLVQCLRSFIEDLIRRSFSKKSEEESKSLIFEPSLRLDDIKSTILNCPQFDFLTNKDIGTIKNKEEIENGETM